MVHVVARGVASSSRTSTSAASPYPYCKKVFVDAANALSRTNIKWRGKSVAASVPSDSSIPSKVQKKIPKHERRAMVESFVDKYRATNAGKFPTISLTKQQIGGSYYVIREILQEVEYKSKFSPVKEKEFPVKKGEEDAFTSSDTREKCSITETEDASGSVSLESGTYRERSSDLGASFSKGLVSDIEMEKTSADASNAHECPIVSVDVENTCDDYLSESANQRKEMPTVPSYVVANSIAEADIMGSIGPHKAQAKSDTTEDMAKPFPGEPDGGRGDVDGLKEAEQKGSQEFSKTEDLYRGISRKLEHEEPSSEKSTVWGKFKSLARGIINFWKKI